MIENFLSKNTTAKTWKNINVGNITCTSINATSGIAADKIKCVDTIPIKQTAPINNQALIYNGLTSQLEFQTLIDNTGITTLNGCSGLIQSFATATDPIDGFQIVSNAGTNTHTFKIGDAEPGKRGFVSAGNQSFSGTKTFLGDINTGGNVIYCNNIMNASGTNLLVTTPRITFSNSDGLYAPKIRNVTDIYFASNAYIRSGSYPTMQAVGTGGISDNYIFGVVPASGTSKHLTMGWNALDRGQIYAYDQALPGAKDIQIGFTGIACTLYTTGNIFMAADRPVLAAPNGSDANIIFGAMINSDATFAAGGIGMSSVFVSTGVIELTFNTTHIYSVTASITEIGQCGYITCENVGAVNGNVWRIVTRDISGSTLAARRFSVTAYGKK